ncbi:MAG: sulfatase-like hydrolase/transferase [Sedimentisphaerales bacterium]|nr:sulfatase-like hydrolase/transferase [Sedimentisphaerales bacterium]
MNRRNFLKALGAGAAVLALPRFARGARSSANRPNILFIFADDQTFEAVRALGNDEVHTPNLDRLVAGGTTFTHAYNQGSWTGAVCVASRTMLNTGMFLWHAHKVDNKTDERFQQGAKMWSELIDSAGYDTYMTGKWHVKADAKSLFDTTAHIRGGMPQQSPEGYNRPIEGKADPWRPYDKQFGGYWEGGRHWSEVLADDAVAFLEQGSKGENPFFMYLAFNAPHDPRQSPKEYVDKYPLNGIKVPKNFAPEHPDKDAIGCGAKLRDERLAPFPRTPYSVKVNRQEYYAIITHMDAQVGRILGALEKSGKAENTYIFFSADHGLAVGRHGLMGKQNLYDHSVRVPLMVVGPGIKKNARIDAPVYLQDIMPTTLELAGAEKPDYVQFKSLMPLMQGETKKSYDAIYGGYLDVARMVTQDGYKLLLFPKAKKVLLFNLKEDPQEMTNLAAQRKQEKRIKKLFAKLLALQEQTGDQLDLKALYPGLL